MNFIILTFNFVDTTQFLTKMILQTFFIHRHFFSFFFLKKSTKSNNKGKLISNQIS